MLAGRARYLGLGPWPGVGLAEAREAAEAARKLIRAGIDPIDQRRQDRVEVARTEARKTTFRQSAEAFIRGHEAAWTPKHARHWRDSLLVYV
jgi:hypothetical protein